MNLLTTVLNSAENFVLKTERRTYLENYALVSYILVSAKQAKSGAATQNFMKINCLQIYLFSMSEETSARSSITIFLSRFRSNLSRM